MVEVALFDAMQGPSLEDRLLNTMEGAREAVRVDRLHLWALAPEGDRLLYVAGSGLSEDDTRSLVERPEMRLTKGGPTAQAMRGEAGLLVRGSDAKLPRLRPAFRAVQSTSYFVAPLLSRDQPLGLLVADNKYGGTELNAKRLRLLPDFASCLAAMVERERLQSQLQEHERNLSRLLDQQTATSEVLRAISRTTFDLGAVLRVLIENATRLAGANEGFIFRFDGELARLAYSYNAAPAYEAYIEANPLAPGRGSLVGRVLLERAPVHIPDVLSDPDFTLYEAQRAGGFRS
ncbi:MAG: GAF domain-containing protein, partial [Betaproteobacteria bacterium]